MKTGVLALSLLAAATAADAQRNRRNDTDAVERACTVTECFRESDIRNFEVIDQTHVIVYTGPQRCAFHVEVRGTFCDLTFAPELYFSTTNEVRTQDTVLTTRDPLGRSGMDPLDQVEPNRRNLRICANDLTIQVHGGPFTESLSRTMSQQNSRVQGPRADCQVTGVTAITDDQLLEFFVSRGALAPPPPMGAAEIEVGEQSGDSAAEAPQRSRGRDEKE
jgi:hypothetical protein